MNCFIRAPKHFSVKIRCYVLGVTFIELLVVMSIATILLSVAVPSFNSTLQAGRFASISNSYLVNLHLARSESIKRNNRVALCKSADGASCTTSGGWDQGWIVFHDVNNNAQADVGEEILRVNESLPTSWVLRGNTPVVDYVSYAPSGGAKRTNDAFQAGTLTLCKVSAIASETRSIVVSATGRPRVEKGTVSACP